MSTTLAHLSQSRTASDERLRASLERLRLVARTRLHHGRARVEHTGHELIRDFLGAEVIILVALAFGVGVLLGHRQRP